MAADPNQNLYVGGEFATAGDTPAIGIAFLNTTTQVWSPLYGYPPPWNGNGVGGTVRAITIADNGKVYVGGSFLSASGTIPDVL